MAFLVGSVVLHGVAPGQERARLPRLTSLHWPATCSSTLGSAARPTHACGRQCCQAQRQKGRASLLPQHTSSRRAPRSGHHSWPSGSPAMTHF